MNEDYKYLLQADSWGVVEIRSPEARASLSKIGYLTPAKGLNSHAMTLTKKGQKRVKEIREQQEEDRKVYFEHNRGSRGAPWPKSYRIAK